MSVGKAAGKDNSEKFSEKKWKTCMDCTKIAIYETLNRNLATMVADQHHFHFLIVFP